jgi:hypothetical protein
MDIFDPDNDLSGETNYSNITDEKHSENTNNLIKFQTEQIRNRT